MFQCYSENVNPFGPLSSALYVTVSHIQSILSSVCFSPPIQLPSHVALTYQFVVVIYWYHLKDILLPVVLSLQGIPIAPLSFQTLTVGTCSTFPDVFFRYFVPEDKQCLPTKYVSLPCLLMWGMASSQFVFKIPHQLKLVIFHYFAFLPIAVDTTMFLPL